MTMASQSTMDTDAHVQTVTRKEQQFARPHIKIPKLFRSNPYRLLSYINNPEDGTFVCDDDLLTAYRRRSVVEKKSSNDLTDYVKFRLFLARNMALLKYREVINT